MSSGGLSSYHPTTAKAPRQPEPSLLRDRRYGSLSPQRRLHSLIHLVALQPQALSVELPHAFLTTDRPRIASSTALLRHGAVLAS